MCSYKFLINSLLFLYFQEDTYKNLASTAFNEAVTVFQSNAWKLDKQKPNGDELYVLDSPKLGKVYMIKVRFLFYLCDIYY